MMIVALIAVVGTLCWLVFTFAVYAVPAFFGLSAAIFAYQTGAGVLGAVIVGLLAGAATLVIGQRLICSARSPSLRFLLTFLFAAPAGVAGYHAVHGIMAVSPTAPGWHELLSVAGGLLVGLVAWKRMAVLAKAGAGGASGGDGRHRTRSGDQQRLTPPSWVEWAELGRQRAGPILSRAGRRSRVGRSGATLLRLA